MAKKKKPSYFFQAFHQIASEVDSGTSTRDVLDRLAKSTTEAIDVKGCSLMLLTPDRRQLIHTVAYGLSDSYIRKGTVKIDPILDEALKGKPICVVDVAADPRVQYKKQAIDEGIVSILSLPMLLRDEIIGILRIYTEKPRKFSADEIEFLNFVATLGAISLRKAKEYESQEAYYEYRLRVQLDKSRRELATVEETKDKLLSFISMVAHDLKAPLAAIHAYFDVMLEGYTGDLSEKHRELIQKSSTRLDGLLEFINDLLDISRIETGQAISEMEDVCLSELTDELLEDVRRLAEEKKIKLKVDVAPSLPVIHGSPVRLQQVLVNLLSNAIKFTPDRGAVSLTLKLEDNVIVVEVRDTGIGIPEQEIEHIFDDFYRASNVATPGSGLGLSIVKRIIQAHGGQIEVHSPCPETNKGCKFTFRLPVNP